MNLSATGNASLASTKHDAALAIQIKADRRAPTATRTTDSPAPAFLGASCDRTDNSVYLTLGAWIRDFKAPSPTTTPTPVLHESSLVSTIVDTSEHREATAALSLFGQRAAAARLNRLLAMTNGDPEEPTISLPSLQGLALFLTSAPQFGEGEIGVSPDGLLQMEWLLDDGGIVAMEFLPDGLIRYAAIANAANPGTYHRPRAHGTGSRDEVLAATVPFLDRRQAV